jgi:hypothetical protein
VFGGWSRGDHDGGRAIEAGAVDVVIVRDIDPLTRNLTDWNAFEEAA